MQEDQKYFAVESADDGTLITRANVEGTLRMNHE